jgi:hypothetical protein
VTRPEITTLADPENFRPFVIVTAGGTRYSIDHPDYIDIPPIPQREECEEVGRILCDGVKPGCGRQRLEGFNDSPGSRAMKLVAEPPPTAGQLLRAGGTRSTSSRNFASIQGSFLCFPPTPSVRRDRFSRLFLLPLNCLDLHSVTESPRSHPGERYGRR